MALHRVLIISYCFPPFGTVDAQRIVKFVKYLPHFNWQAVILTARFAYRNPFDFSYLQDIPKGTRIYRVFNPEPTSLFPWRLKSLLDEALMIPDDKILWLPFAIKTALKIIRDERIEVIFATGSPWTVLLIGQRLKNLSGIPLVVDLRDPWTQNINRVWRSQIRYEKETQVESQVLKNADHIITVSEPIREMLIEKYPFTEDKVTVIFNGYDEEDFKDVDRNYQNQKMVISNHGSYYGEKPFRNFLLALRQITLERPELEEKIEVRFIGNQRWRTIKRTVRELRLSSVVKLTGYVEHAQNIRCLLSSDLLIIIRPQSYAYSAKIFEYLASGKPILALAPTNGVVAELIKKANAGLAVEPDDIRAIKQGILHFYKLWEKGQTASAFNWNIIRQFERKRLTQRLAHILDRIAGIK